MRYFYLFQHTHKSRSHKLTFRLLFLLIFFSGVAFVPYLAPPPGLTTPEPIGAFLNGILPDQTPGDGGNISWGVAPIYPNLSFQDPLVILPHPTQNKIIVASRQGLIEIFDDNPNVSNKQTLIDLRTQVGVVWDAGFLGMAFHPEFGQAGSPNRNYFYVYYTAKGPNGQYGPFSCGSGCFTCFDNPNWYGSYLRLSRFTVNDGTLTASPGSEQIMINVRQYNGTHRGGGLVFGDDGFLYLTIGDQARYSGAQNLVNNFEGGVIRLDVDQKGGSISHAPRRKMGVHTGNVDEYTGVGYYVPNDNPWLSTSSGLFEEFWTIGHRSPHRMTKDRLTGDLWIGEVGQGSREEINLVEKGGNYGWPAYEGNLGPTDRCNTGTTLSIGTYKPPVTDFLRSEANSIIGGYVYRGAAFPSLYGQYICGGYSQDRIFAVESNGNKTVLTSFTPGSLITFGESTSGELLMGRQNGNTTLYTLTGTGGNEPAPQLLSQTGAFKNLSTLEPEDGVIPYDMIEDFWSDGAEKSRWLAIPNNGTHNTAAEQIQFSENGNWTFPTGAVLIKHFEIGGRRLETRFEVLGTDGNFYYLTYKWNSQGTDATLLLDGLDETITVNGQSQVWHYPSPSECVNCHKQAAGNVLGLKTRYLNRNLTYPKTGQTGNQLVTLSYLGILDQNITDADVGGFLTSAAKNDANASLEFRARSYLDLNCANCHQPGTGNRAVFDARLTTPLTQQDLINGPLNDNLGISGARVIVPQDLPRSMIHHRMNSLQSGVAMPPLAKNVVDDDGVQLIADWINSLTPTNPTEEGLEANYFDNQDFTNPIINRIDPVVNFNWGTGSPDPSMGADNFSIRWDGLIEVPVSGSYTFYTNTDDGVRLWVNDQLLIDKWIPQSPTEWSASISLTQGALVNITMEYYEQGGGAVAQLSWSGPGIGKQIIPSQYLHPPGYSPFPPCTASGNILMERWDNITGTSVSQIPLSTAPDANQLLTLFEIPTDAADNYGARVSGYICAPATGDYTFWLASDDNGELWLSTDSTEANKALIASVPGWTSPREWTKFPEQQSSPVYLEAGKKYYVEALMKEGAGLDNMAVGWQLPGGTMERPITGSRLSPADAVPIAQDQTITFDPIGDKFTTDGPFQLVASASSGLPVSFSIVSGPASVSGNTVTLDGNTGTVVVRASQAGDANYNPAPDVDQSFDVTEPAGDCFVEAGGQVVMEAENYSTAIAGTGNASGSNWQSYSDGAASAGTALRAEPNTGVWTGLNLNGPRLDYEINFSTTGTYRVYVRSSAPGANDDSYHVGLNGNAVTNNSGYGMDINGSWAWADDANGGQDVEIVVPSTGKHTFNLWMREDGVQVDKIVLTKLSGPSGVGPAESAKGACGGAANQAPVASFTATPTSGIAPLQVNVDASASSDNEGPIASYSWNFGDGNTATGVTASHIYTNEGQYTITLIVTDQAGLTGQSSTQINVSPDPGNGALCFTESNGQVIIEAENYSAASAGTGNVSGNSWQTYSDGTASGGSGVQAMPDQGGWTGLNTNGPRLDYDITFNTTGTYYVYIRSAGSGSQSDSYHAGLNGTAVTNSSAYGMDNNGPWQWVDDANGGTPVQVVVSSTGQHTFNIWMREDGVQIDKIVLKLASGKPSGSGPAESPQSLCPSQNNLAFAVAEQNGDAQINWGNFHEAFQDYHILERSTDGQIYQVLTEDEIIVDQSDFSFTDLQVDQLGVSKIYYRLRIVDAQGQTRNTRHGVLEFGAFKDVFRLYAYPSPATERLIVEFEDPKGLAGGIRVLNLQGKAIFEENSLGKYLDRKIKLDVSNWPGGVYYIQLFNDRMSESVRVVVK